MIRTGQFVSQFIEPINKEQIQPNGVDLTLSDILRTRSIAILKDDNYDYGERESVDTWSAGIYHARGGKTHFTLEEIDEDHHLYKYKDNKHNPIFEIENEFYTLTHGTYIAVYNETIEIPEGHVGFLWPRSRFPRSHMFLTSAVWDQGYKGIGEGMLMVPDHYAVIEKGMRIGQMVFMEAEKPDEMYEGSHQGERL